MHADVQRIQTIKGRKLIMKIRKIAALLLAGVMTLGICSCSKSEKTDWDYIADKGTFVAGITLLSR